MVLRILPLTGLLIMQFISSLVYAQTDIDHIIVTGSYTPIAVNEIGNSYTIITDQDIKRRQSVLLSDLLRDVPGFAVSRSGPIGSQTQIRVRGAEANHVLVMIDGIETNNPVDGEFSFEHLITDNIERIEIIRGPQSSLYGSDALAGVINIITKKDDQLGIVSSGAMEIGVPNMIHANGHISAAGKNYLYRLHGSYLGTSGTNISIEGNEKDGYDNITLSFIAENEATENLKLSIAYRYTDATNEFDLGDPPTDANRLTEIKQNYLSGRAKLGLLNNTWQHTLSMAVTNQASNDFYDNIKQSDIQGTRIRLNYHTNLHFNTSDFTYAKHILTLGADHEKELFDQENTESQDITIVGLIVGYHISLWQRLFLSANIRHDDNSDFKNATTYRSTLAYQIPISGTRFHASYGTGIKNPTFAERFGSFVGFISNPDLKPEQSKSWDIGIEQIYLHGHASIDLTYFNSRLEDEINGFAPILSSPGMFTANNFDRISKRQGIEISSRVQLIERTNLTINYTYLDSMERKTREIRRPQHMASINIDYTLPDKMTTFNLNVNFTGKQVDHDFSMFPVQRVTLSDYTLANIAISHHFSSKTSLYGRIENLTDKRYQDVFGYQNTGISGIVGIKLAF